MLRLFNTAARKKEVFRPADRGLVSVFTCGPSVYQRSHLGNFRTFLFEDVLVRYLEYKGYIVRRGMNLTDIEDKAIEEASRRKMDIKQLTGGNIRAFIREMRLLRMKVPDYLPRASECVEETVDMIEQLLEIGIAYRNKENIYFDPLKFAGFGKLYGLDMKKWPAKKRRFHKDTYPGMQWNMGDFILWHGYKRGDNVFWDTRIGRGRPSWNVQDPAMVSRFFNETLSIYCGGIDNLFRHHDYSLAVLESVRPYPMARYWLHGNHLFVNGKKMSKSRGNIYYTDTLLNMGYSLREVRFFLIYGHYREKLHYSDPAMRQEAETLRSFLRDVNRTRKMAGTKPDGRMAEKIKTLFEEKMDDDLNVRAAFDSLRNMLSESRIECLGPGEAAGVISALKKIDRVLQVVF